MIEINLVPDIKQEFLRSQRLRAKVISVSILACLAAVGVVTLLFVYMGTQAIRNALADNDIKQQYDKLTKDYPDLAKVVTIQNQLSIVSNLNDKKQITSRVFDLLRAINPEPPHPNNIKMSTISIDPLKSTLTIEGAAEQGYNAGDAFKKTILNTTVSYNKGKDYTVPLATSVTVSNATFGEDASGKKVLRFKASFVYPKELMSNEVTNVIVASPTTTIDVTDSHVGIPQSLFAQPAADIEEGN